jgi:hypothetical protein
MSDYKDFIRDFPSRCEKLLNRIEREHRFDDLTVTGLLMVASSAVNIPYERLRPPSDERKAHPSGDYEKYAEAAQQFKQLSDSNFVGSCLCPSNIDGNWRLVTTKSVQGPPDAWDCSFKHISKEKKVSSVIAIIRNALAHGNIFTKSGTVGGGELGRNSHAKIREIVLVSVNQERDKKGDTIYGTVKDYTCISVTPAAFKQFLHGWFAFVKGLTIYPYIVEDFEDMDKYAAIG